jgi:hypothetical protein
MTTYFNIILILINNLENKWNLMNKESGNKI